MSSTSGRSSRSTLMQTKCSLRVFATSGFENVSRSMTWHQWQELYPIERKMSFFSLRARSNASGPHGYQSTGLYACWSRYGLVSSARRLGMAKMENGERKTENGRRRTEDG